MGRTLLHDEEHGPGRESPTTSPPCAPSAPPPLAAVPVLSDAGGNGGNISASAFLSYVSLGFGATVAVIVIIVCTWLISRHVMQRRRAREQQAAAAAQDARRQQVENVQRMIEEKRQRAAAARRPFLVVHPGGDAVVAFKESCKPEPSGDGEGGLLIKAHKAAPGVDGSAACGSGSGCSTPSEALMSRRALVAAAALSGRTSSGLADAMADLPFGAAPAGDDLVSTSQQQQQQVELQQAEGSMRACPSAQSLSRQSSLAAPLLGRPRGSTSSVAGLDGAAGAPGEAPGPSNGNTGSSPEIV